MSEDNAPIPGDESPFTPPPPIVPPAPTVPAASPVLPASPVPPVPQPAQAYPGAAPTYSPPGQVPYGAPAAYAPAPVIHPGYTGYAAPAYPVVAPRPTSGLAITSLICGIAGLFLIWAFIPVLASIAAVITGHLALGQIKRDPQVGGRGPAIAGLILGYVAVGVGAFTVVSTILSFLFVGAFSLPFLLSS